MDNIIDNYHPIRGKNPWLSFFILILFVLVFLFIGQFLGVAIITSVFGFSLTDLSNVLLDPESFPEARVPVYVLQAFTALGAFIVAPLLYLQIWEKKSISVFFLERPINSIILLITGFIVIAFMFVNSVFVEWNAQLTLPEFMKPFEDWAYEKEQQAKLLTEFLTRFENLNQFLLGLLIIAVIPAVGEELLFRGIIQNQMLSVSKNIHVAIWVTGFLFSAMHLQFYGLIPRMMLGVLFGYMYYWSGNLIIPIVAHFVNNAFTLTMLYLYQLKSIEFDMESQTSVPWYVSLPGLLVGAVLLLYFRNYMKQNRLIDE